MHTEAAEMMCKMETKYGWTALLLGVYNAKLKNNISHHIHFPSARGTVIEPNYCYANKEVIECLWMLSRDFLEGGGTGGNLHP